MMFRRRNFHGCFFKSLFLVLIIVLSCQLRCSAEDETIADLQVNDGQDAIKAIPNTPKPIADTSGHAGATEEVGAALDKEAADAKEKLKFTPAFVRSLLMIIVTELGDKTFFIAAILAMRHRRLLVFTGAIGALALMTVLSTLMGFALPNLIPRVYTHYASAALFLYFGIRLLKDGVEMKSSGPSEELAEVEEELSANKKGEDVESGDGPPKSQSTGSVRNITPVQVVSQAFTLTFLAEWGDRSQIATIALAAARDPYGVTVGGVLGHALCTGLAVIGGRMLAASISEKTVHIVGGSLFLLFSFHSLFFEE
mmetsp:Transcript_31122/g.41159  ORF Transcript_31122/g.41159 Transcript_31122/m.41159 type:complete len:311 (+) Transcript_31122:119-1051(+)|eukprot:CAMPEP_0117759398 /NCGR_PEP_ID=MMETSP0947-20121206/15986_1 /TAXON_ID=44440 /ORGANISM="Chattonella subsalsa, Strain CCMP2191" /LENGTH=310 /DNA_ID=CAMNT_0005579841 /DNA_START=232 /DNA_END=1164 /DNA_ORIENTATION=-